jgi:hypothetical protein
MTDEEPLPPPTGEARLGLRPVVWVPGLMLVVAVILFAAN